MRINDFLRKAARCLLANQIAAARGSVAKQKSILQSIPQPKDDIDRAFAQYRCQKKLRGFCFHFFSSAASFVFFLPKFVRSDFSGEKMKSDAVFVSENIPENVIPGSLRDEFGSIAIASCSGNERFDKEDRRIFFKIWRRHPFAFSFLFKALIKIRLYSAIIEQYSPRAIITCNEFSFTSSLLTVYCRERGVEHIDVMHGEKVFDITNSFFHFDRCFVWDQSYVDLFLKLRAEKEQFCVEVPPSLLFEKKSAKKCFDYTYYLQDQSGERLSFIVDAMKRLSEKGNRVAIRPHPRHTPMKELKKLCEDGKILIENTKELSIEDSVLRTGCAVSVFSTVLQQAYYNQIAIAIDDISDPKKTEFLVQADFVMLQKPHEKLSRLIEKQ